MYGAGTDAGTGACAGVAAVGDAANGASVPPALAGIAGAAQAAAVRCPLQLPPCRPFRSRPAGSGRADLPHAANLCTQQQVSCAAPMSEHLRAEQLAFGLRPCAGGGASASPVQRAVWSQRLCGPCGARGLRLLRVTPVLERMLESLDSWAWLPGLMRPLNRLMQPVRVERAVLHGDTRPSPFVRGRWNQARWRRRSAGRWQGRSAAPAPRAWWPGQYSKGYFPWSEVPRLSPHFLCLHISQAFAPVLTG